MSSDILSQFEIGLKSLANATNKNSIQMNQIYINKINNIHTKKKQIDKKDRKTVKISEQITMNQNKSE